MSIKQTLTTNELKVMVAVMQSVEVELDEHDMQCAKAEYEHHQSSIDTLH